MNIELLAIDPQYDFCAVPEEYKKKLYNPNTQQLETVEPALPVEKAWEDSIRLSEFVKRAGKFIDQITVTLDTHQLYDIGHPLFWRDQKGKMPDPFTTIYHQDILDGKWTPIDHTKKDYVLHYTKKLEDEGLYNLFIWPPHCLVGTPGHNVVDPILFSLRDWERNYIGRVNYVTKGHNPYTEHYGGFQAEVPLPEDPTTLLNSRLIEHFEKADIVLLTGQALSHCVASTVMQLIDNFGEENVKKLVLLEDTSSPVAGFEKNAEDFLKTAKSKGMRTIKTTDIKVNQSGIQL